mmetsp:Transcript_47877/g.135258  ORF Transcript_47877/g.135258 Transcript_47877/m.135258 type:complete len:217 (+) Transcript_47877:327-977(+)
MRRRRGDADDPHELPLAGPTVRGGRALGGHGLAPEEGGPAEAAGGQPPPRHQQRGPPAGVLRRPVVVLRGPEVRHRRGDQDTHDARGRGPLLHDQHRQPGALADVQRPPVLLRGYGDVRQQALRDLHGGGRRHGPRAEADHGSGVAEPGDDRAHEEDHQQEVHPCRLRGRQRQAGLVQHAQGVWLLRCPGRNKHRPGHHREPLQLRVQLQGAEFRV